MIDCAIRAGWASTADWDRMAPPPMDRTSREEVRIISSLASDDDSDRRTRINQCLHPSPLEASRRRRSNGKHRINSSEFIRRRRIFQRSDCRVLFLHRPWPCPDQMIYGEHQQRRRRRLLVLVISRCRKLRLSVGE